VPQCPIASDATDSNELMEIISMYATFRTTVYENRYCTIYIYELKHHFFSFKTVRAIISNGF